MFTTYLMQANCSRQRTDAFMIVATKRSRENRVNTSKENGKRKKNEIIIRKYLKRINIINKTSILTILFK